MMDNVSDTAQAPAAGAKASSSSVSGSSTSVAPPERPSSQASSHKSSTTAVTNNQGGSGGHVPTHRQSFAENLRNPPPSPRSQRHLSFTQSAVQELLNHPPASKVPNPQFAGRDWRDIAVGELVSHEDVKWVEMDASVEEATMVLLKSGPANVVLIRDSPADRVAASTFDYNDLNAYLLVVVGLARPEGENVAIYDDIASKARDRVPIPLRDIQTICRKESLVTFPADEPLARGIEILGSGVHRVLVTSPFAEGEAVGILSQLKVLEFFWSEAVSFPVIDRLYPVPLRDLHIGTQQIIAINADRPLADALTLMSNEGLTSVAVVDNGLNVVGNISTADVRHLTSAASMPLLESSCMHFISVILSERGVEKGRDSFPVFYVNPYSSLAHTVAKLTATQSHRMWVVETASPSPSIPGTPLLQPIPAAAVAAGTPLSASTSTTTATASNAAASQAGGPTVVIPTPAAVVPASPLPSPSSVSSVPASALPGAHLSGRLTGVVSLTDILNLFARSSGLQPTDPGEQRARRRRSSSSSVRPSMESSRASVDFRR